MNRAALPSALLLAVACAGQPPVPGKKEAAMPKLDSPLLAPWTGPYGGVPPFGRFRPADLRQALEAGMADNLREVDEIANDAQPPTFENTIAALERSGQPLDRATSVYGVYTSTMNDAEVQAIQSEMAPKLSAFNDRIVQNPKLFARIAAVYEERDRLQLTPEQQRLLWLTYTAFVRQGARLDDAGKKKLSDLNQELATLSTKFGQNLLAEEGAQMVVLESEADLASLSPALRDAAASAAAARKLEGKWAILNTRSSVEPFLTFSARRDLREKVWRMFVSRGDNGDEHDNNGVITRILQLRAQRAHLLGYPTHAHWKLEDQMAKTPERAIELMEAVWTPAVARVREEVGDMQAIANKEKVGAASIEPWDYRYYAEKVRKAKYDLDESELKPYLQLEKLREGMFYVAAQLFGLRFDPITDGSVPVYHPDVRVFRVTRDGKHVGLWFFDPYARPGKQSGAWMNEYRRQQRLVGDVPVIVSNNANFVKGKPSEPVLVSWDDAKTLFHEFGHALHGLNSSVTYPSLSGTNVARDYVEFPSQLLERWLTTRAVLDGYARHFQTGQPMPPGLVARIEKTEKFNQGFITVEYLSAALVDMKLHMAGEAPIDPRRFERETLASLGMPKEIVMRHRTPQFAHIFGDAGYSAGYYSYLWSDTLSADAWEAFLERGGPYDKSVASRLREDVFSAGNTRDPAEAYRAFRGRDPGIGALMRRRGFPDASPARASAPGN